MPKLKLPQKSLPTLLKLRTETAILQDKLIPKEFAHALTERTTYLKETNVYVPNTLLSGTANTALDVLPEWTSIWTSESATSALKDSFEDTRSWLACLASYHLQKHKPSMHWLHKKPLKNTDMILIQVYTQFSNFSISINHPQLSIYFFKD